MKIAYAVCSLLVLTVLGLMSLAGGTSLADDCPCSGSGNFCGWLAQPQSTPANGLHFNTATEGNPNELTIEWCFEDNPTGGIVQFVSGESSNISSVEYTPDSFDADCSGEVEIFAEGDLASSADGTLVSRALIGPFPGCGQSVDKELFIDN